MATIKLVAHYRLGTSFDSALLGNVAWRLGNGLSSVSSLTGYPYFATHASGAIFLLAPVFRFWPTLGLPIAFVWQSLSIAMVGLAVMWICSSLHVSHEARRFLLFLSVLAPGVFLASRLDLHEPTLGLGFLAMTLATGIDRVPARRSWWWPFLAAACRLEMAAATFAGGIVLLRKPDGWRFARVPLFAGALGLAFSLWFVAQAGSDAVSVGAHFAHLGDTPESVLKTAFDNPWLVLQPLTNSAMLSAIAFWLLPMGLVLPAIGWRYLLVALPMAAVPIFGVWAPADQYAHHYWYGFLVAAPIAAAFGLARRPRLLNVFRISAGVGLIAAWVPIAAALPAIRPFGQSSGDEMRTISELSSESVASVSATNAVLAHLIARPTLFAFPRPFLCDKDLGPFRWEGEMPELIVVRAGDQEEVENDRLIGAILLQSYQANQSENDLVVYRLEDSTVRGIDCIDP
jgi:hypothetical protein